MANGQGSGFRAGFNSTFPVSIPLPIANITYISICTVCPTEAKPMLQAGLLSCVATYLSEYQLFLSYVLSVGLCVGKVLFFFKGGDFLFFSGLEKAYSFASLGFWQGLCDLQMCMLCVCAFIFY